MKPYYQDGAVTIYHGDCREVLDSIDFSSACAVTDPPYGDTNLPWDGMVDGWLAYLERKMGMDASLWMFTSLRHLLKHLPALVGWVLAEEIVWEKHNGTNLHADRFRRVHELAVHLYRGEWSNVYAVPPKMYQAHARVVRKKSRPAQWLGQTGATTFVQPAGMTKIQRSVIRARSEHRRGHHPTQKPLSVVQALVECSCAPSDTVIDPFMGAGTTLVAARNLGRKAIGIEIEERYCEIAARRCAQEVLAL